MKKIIFYIIFFFILGKRIICERKLDSSCENITSCYDCYLKQNCIWCPNNNICMNSLNKSNCNTSFISNLINNNNYIFLTNQYKCILNESDIEFHYNKNKFSYTLINNYTDTSTILYKIICLEYNKIRKISIDIEIINENGIYDLSYYNYLKKENYVFQNSSGKQKIKCKTINLCIKISYLPSNYESNSLKIDVNKIFVINAFQIISIVGSCLISIMLILSLIIILYKKYHKNLNEIRIKQNKMKIIINKKRYKDLKQQSEIDSTGVNSINNSKENDKKDKSEKEEKKKDLLNQKTINEYLKKKINLLPSFIVDDTHSSFELYICNLCEKKFTRGNKIIILSCNHFFHEACLDNQIITNENNKCIVCKSPIIQ